jgi:mono/diheme cytochrome c family protein
MKLNNILKYGIILGIPALSMVSCISSGDNPGIEYAPNMYISQAYEPYSQEKKFGNNPNGMTMRLPVNGTVARGQASFIYPHPNTGDGYAASASFTPWTAATEDNVAEGQRLYNIYCWHCHGKKGKNDGPIFKDKKIPAPSWANYQSDYIKELPLGKAFHTIVYGKGLMGSHSFMLDPEERWKVIHYVKSLAFGDDFQYAEDNTDPILSSEDMDADIKTSLDSQASETVVLEIYN